MSQDALQMVRAGYEAFNRGDTEAAIAPLHPDIEWWPAADEPITAPYRGHDGYRRLVAGIREAVPNLQIEIEELSTAGDCVVACLRFRGRGRDSGVPVEIRETHVARLRDGKVIEVREYRDKDAALEAAGLREEAMSQDDLATTFRRAIEAYSRGDYDAAVLDFDPAVEWSVDLSVTPDAGTYHGHQGVKQFWETWAEAISGMELEIEECRDVGQHRVLAIIRARGVGAGSGAPVASPRFANIADFRDGRVVKVRVYGGDAAALEAGLRE